MTARASHASTGGPVPDTVTGFRRPRRPNLHIQQITLGHARGAILLAAALREVPIAEYTAPEIKQAVAGTGRATKEQVAFMVQQHLRLKTPPAPADAADGVAAALCHCYRGSLPG